MKTYAPVSIVPCNSLWAASAAQLAVPELRRDLGRNLRLLNSLVRTPLVLLTSLLKTFLVLLASLLKKPVDWGFGCDSCAPILAGLSRPGGSGKGYQCSLCSLGGYSTTGPQVTFLVWEDDGVPG